MMFPGILCGVVVAFGTPHEAIPGVDSRLTSGGTATATIPSTTQPRTLSVVVALKQPGRLPAGSAVRATTRIGTATLTKALHLGDPDVTWSIAQPAGAVTTVELKAENTGPAPIDYTVRVTEAAVAEDGVAIEAEPNDSPETANPLALGRTIYGLADDRPYWPSGEQTTDAEGSAGKDWFRFDFDSEIPKLAFFALEFVDRDVPPDVRVYQIKDGKPVEYTKGIDPQSLQRERPPRLGANKFTTRVLSKGTYYVLVDACHPDYQLRTRLYDVPAGANLDAADAEAVAAAARSAVRTAMDFQLLAGDSWHANTPRKGHALDRVSNVHHETSTCIACHPTHFTTQSALGAVRNGYKIEQPFAMQFLTERLYNNPVPFHGHPGAVWARMIPAPANVLGRLSTMTMDFENMVAGPPRDNTHRGIAEFLKLYYDSRDELPPDETNGNNPISRYKVAADSWRQLDEMFRRTGEARFAETRDLVARLLPTGEHTNTRDLAAQTIGLCLVDRARLAPAIEANVKRLLDLQRADGHWSPKFDPKSQRAEMQTGESLYALSLAGLPNDHPAMRKGTVALLKEQEMFGGWLDISPHEQFQTPFRETQWALIALSRLYPGPGTKGWNGPLGPQPKILRTGSVSAILQDLERIWDEPAPELHAAIVALLDDDRPLVRFSACQTLARIGRESSLSPLADRLGDESKVVQRASAEALRLIGNRLNAQHRPGETAEQEQWVATLTGALGSPDDRVRRGATRLFAAHFRELSQELDLAELLLQHLDDPDPVVATQAIKGLWRWWYWRDDLSLRNRIEDGLIARLDRPAHPWVRRNAIEALYIIGDENIRYLYKNWVPALASEASRDRATAAQHATVNRLGDKYVAALTRGGPLQREGILRAISEFHERPGGSGRVGNDTEPMLFYDDALPRVSSALTAQMSDADPTIRRLALQTLVSLRGFRDPALSRAVASRRGDPDPEVREWAGTMAKDFPLAIKPGKADPALLAVVDDLLANPLVDSKTTALGLLGRLGPNDVPGLDRSAKVRDSLKAEVPAVRAAALRALAAFPRLLAEAPVRESVRSSLADADVDVRVAAIRLALDRPGLVNEKVLRTALDDPTPEHRIALLTAIAPSKSDAADLRLIGVISDSLVDDNGGVREKALQVIQARPETVANPAIEDGLREVSRSDNARQKEIAKALLVSRGRSSVGDAGADLLDVAYFETNILPIFNAMGEDGQNCMGCHRSHTILTMVPPGKDGRWSPQAVRANFRATLRVINLANPTDSLLLGKPTWDAAEEAEAQNDPTKKAHAGGVRFEPKTSPEYQTILDWINGARSDSKPGAIGGDAAARR